LYFWGAANHVPSGSYTQYNATWGEEDYLYNQLKMMYDHYTTKGYPVILGEYGANWRNLGNAALQKKHDASIKLFNRLVCEYSINHGAVPFVWDINVANQNGTGGIMTVIDRNSLSVFCPPAMEGILEGTAAATWPAISDIEQIETADPKEKQSSQLPTYNLWGQPTTDSQRGFVIRQGKLILR
ncbi:MAG: cellulase family glycosylhydrolase, partial [Bacteroidales bacterium]|nr:cellulase family glycosylhydrolase [Bacteroidales bacterium]